MKDGFRRSPVLAGVLSAVVPGLGQIYAASAQRGLVLMLGIPAQAALFYGVGLHWLAWCMAVVWLWNIIDAWSLAQGRQISATVPAVIILAMNLIPAWTLTGIRVPKLNAPQRSAIGSMLGGLATPDFVSPRDRERATSSFIVPGVGAPERLEPQKGAAGAPRIGVTPERATKGQVVTVSGANFAPGQPGKLVLVDVTDVQVASFRTDSRGRFEASFANPSSAPGRHDILAEALKPPGGWQISETLRSAAPLMLQTIYLALVGTVLSLVFAIPLSFFGARNLMCGSKPLKAIYGLTRGIFTVLRSVEVLIFALIAVAAVGVGPFAGVIALAVHGIGALGKLYSEAIESIEHGPIEALRATGASEPQVVVYAVIPQVVPQFTAFTLYRWDINVRMATVIGMVGGGGIGAELFQYMNLMQWKQAATAIWLIAGVVMLMDYASAVIREKIG